MVMGSLREETQVVVIGSGPGGYVAALRLAAGGCGVVQVPGPAEDVPGTDADHRRHLTRGAMLGARHRHQGALGGAVVEVGHIARPWRLRVRKGAAGLLLPPQ